MAAMKALTERANVVKTTQEAAIRAVNEQKTNAKPTRAARKKTKEATWTTSFKRLLGGLMETKRGNKATEQGTLYGLFSKLGYTLKGDLALKTLIPDIILHSASEEPKSNIQTAMLLQTLQTSLTFKQLGELWTLMNKAPTYKQAAKMLMKFFIDLRIYIKVPRGQQGSLHAVFREMGYSLGYHDRTRAAMLPDVLGEILETYCPGLDQVLTHTNMDQMLLSVKT
jgi:hypothetical protein